MYSIIREKMSTNKQTKKIISKKELGYLLTLDKIVVLEGKEIDSSDLTDDFYEVVDYDSSIQLVEVSKHYLITEEMINALPVKKTETMELNGKTTTVITY